MELAKKAFDNDTDKMKRVQSVGDECRNIITAPADRCGDAFQMLDCGLKSAAKNNINLNFKI